MKHILTLCLLLAALLCLSAGASASGLLSPGMDVLAEGTRMIASGLVTGEIRFTEADFENAAGITSDGITFTALPPASDGRLLLGDAPVTVNQRVRPSSLSSLRFVPAAGATDSSFRFRTGSGCSVTCLLRYTEEANGAPVIPDPGDAAECWTQCDIAVFGTLAGSDPDGDPVLFEIRDYPEKGLLELTDAARGSYRYTPFDGVKGTDSFTYTVRDEWGHYSAPASVAVRVEKAAADLELSDMDGHWAHNAALVMAAEGAMDVRYENGALLFDPDSPVSREDFLRTVMRALGSGDIAPASTVFADDAEISAETSGYVARAYRLGIVRGGESGGKLWFRPKDPVTRAEAAVILNAILGAEESDAVAVFADSSDVPAWARPSLSALTSAGILRGNGTGKISADAGLTRAETAEILLKIRRTFG